MKSAHFARYAVTAMEWALALFTGVLAFLLFCFAVGEIEVLFADFGLRISYLFADNSPISGEGVLAILVLVVAIVILVVMTLIAHHKIVLYDLRHPRGAGYIGGTLAAMSVWYLLTVDSQILGWLKSVVDHSGAPPLIRFTIAAVVGFVSARAMLFLLATAAAGRLEESP